MTEQGVGARLGTILEPRNGALAKENQSTGAKSGFGTEQALEPAWWINVHFLADSN